MSSVSWVQTLVAGQVDGPALTAASAASCIPTPSKITLPNNYFTQAGQALRITMGGKVSTVITTPGTMRFDIRLGGTVVWDSQAVALDTASAYTNMPWKLVVDITCRAAGAGSTTTFIGTGVLFSMNIAGAPASPPKGMAPAMLPWNTTPAVGTGVDATSALSVDVFFTQTVSTGSLTVLTYLVESMN